MKEQMIQVLLRDSSCDTLTKMLFGYVLNMPHNEKHYYEKLQVVVEFAEECLPMHAGAFAAYIRILEKFPVTMKRAMPQGMQDYIEANIEEIEKYYEEKVPQKYRKNGIVEPDKRLVDASGNVLGSPTPVEAPKLILPD